MVRDDCGAKVDKQNREKRIEMNNNRYKCVSFFNNNVITFKRENTG